MDGYGQCMSASEPVTARLRLRLSQADAHDKLERALRAEIDEAAWPSLFGSSV